MLAHQEMTMKIIYVLSLIIFVVMLVHVAERWDLGTTLPNLCRAHVAPKHSAKPRRPWKRQNKKRRGGGAKPPSPVHQQDGHAPRQSRECKQYSWEVPDECPLMDEIAEEKGPQQQGPDEKEKEWLRARLASLLDGELDGVNVM
jgi:hypothetical protein